MKNFSRSILLLICLTVLFASFVGAQEKQTLKPNQPITFLLSSDEEKSFKIVMKEGDFAEVMWLANESLELSFDIYNSAQKNLVKTTSSDGDSVLFIAPKDDEYIFTTKLNKSAEISGSQNISLEYKDKFKLPTGTKQKDIRKINGYDVKIMVTPSSGTEIQNSLILIEKNGRLLKIMKAFGGEIGGFSFGDDLSKAYTNKAKRGIALIKNTIDKTGDEVPDVMIDYYSGGAHCCFETYFINLGETVETVDTVGTGHIGIIVSGKNPKGGLLFETADNGYAYWLGGFAGSPFPNVILEFRNGKLRPNFNLIDVPTKFCRKSSSLKI